MGRICRSTHWICCIHTVPRRRELGRFRKETRLLFSQICGAVSLECDRRLVTCHCGALRYPCLSVEAKTVISRLPIAWNEHLVRACVAFKGLGGSLKGVTRNITTLAVRILFIIVARCPRVVCPVDLNRDCVVRSH